MASHRKASSHKVQIKLHEPQFASLLFPLFYHSGSEDLHFVHWFVLAIGLDQAHSLDHPHSTLDPAKDRVLPVQPRCRRQGDKELAAVGIRSAVRHAQHAGASVLQVVTNLVFEFLAVDGAPSAAGTGGITGLDHEVGDDSVEEHVVVVASLREGRKIFASLVDRMSVGGYFVNRRGDADLGRMGVVELDREGALLESVRVRREKISRSLPLRCQMPRLSP